MVIVMASSRDVSKAVKSWGMRMLRIVGQASPHTRSIARRSEVLPEPFGPTKAVTGPSGTSTSSSDR